MKKLASALALLSIATVTQAYGYDNHAIDELDIDIVSDRGRHFETFPLRSSSDDTFRAYLEAVPQANYSIRVRNRGAHRIGVVIAVDGRNIISGKKSDLRRTERMYILGPYQSATYSGWRTTRNSVNRFYFTDVEDSYSAAFGDYSAMGVISVAAFRERERYREPQRWSKRDDHDPREALPRSDSGKSGDSAARAQKHGRLEYDEPGTGWGDEAYSPVRRVEFEAGRQAFARYFMKYEWRETLCEKGVTDCRDRYSRSNRMWNDRWEDSGFAPPPRRRWFSRWSW